MTTKVTIAGVPPTPPLPSGLRVREIQTRTVVEDGVTRVEPVLGDDGQEIELSAIDIPMHLEAKGAEAIDTHVLEQLTTPAIADAAPVASVVEVAENPPTSHEGDEA